MMQSPADLSSDTSLPGAPAGSGPGGRIALRAEGPSGQPESNRQNVTTVIRLMCLIIGISTRVLNEPFSPVRKPHAFL